MAQSAKRSESVEVSGPTARRSKHALQVVPPWVPFARRADADESRLREGEGVARITCRSGSRSHFSAGASGAMGLPSRMLPPVAEEGIRKFSAPPPLCR